MCNSLDRNLGLKFIFNRFKRNSVNYYRFLAKKIGYRVVPSGGPGSNCKTNELRVLLILGFLPFDLHRCDL
jgi:hypothetical protein